MEIFQTAENSLVISEIEPFVLGLFHAIAEAAETKGDQKATDRIFQYPTQDNDEETRNEWAEYVHPDLKHIFESAVETVERDLRTAGEAAGVNPPALTIARAHFDAWLSALNQARLSLCERHRFTEEDLEDSVPDDITSERGLALFQIHFYGFMQEVILRAMDSGSPG